MYICKKKEIMANRIIKQPNGKYCIYSTEIDNITNYDMSTEEIVDFFLEIQRVSITWNVNDIVSKLEKEERPYYQFTSSFEEILEQIKDIHGEEEYDLVKNTVK